MRHLLAGGVEPPLSEAETTLRELGVPYVVQTDGTLRVKGSISLDNKDLSVLPDLSDVIVEGYFSCSRNNLTSLKGAPQVVEGNFFCSGNKIASFEHGPRRVGNLMANGNLLVSLAHAPETDGSIDVAQNPLKYLEHAPRSFTRLKSDLGDFRYWDDIPENLRVSSETRARLERERILAHEKQIRQATVLEADMPLDKPFRLKTPVRFRRPGP